MEIWWWYLITASYIQYNILYVLLVSKYEIKTHNNNIIFERVKFNLIYTYLQ